MRKSNLELINDLMILKFEKVRAIIFARFGSNFELSINRSDSNCNFNYQMEQSFRDAIVDELMEKDRLRFGYLAVQ